MTPPGWHLVFVDPVFHGKMFFRTEAIKNIHFETKFIVLLSVFLCICALMMLEYIKLRSPASLCLMHPFSCLSTFINLADTFIQSGLRRIHASHFVSSHCVTFENCKLSVDIQYFHSPTSFLFVIVSWKKATRSKHRFNVEMYVNVLTCTPVNFSLMLSWQHICLTSN